MCKGCKLNRDEDSRKEFLEMVLFWMQDTQSFVAVEESTGRTIGVLVGRVIHLEGHTKTMSRSRVGTLLGGFSFLSNSLDSITPV